MATDTLEKRLRIVETRLDSLQSMITDYSSHPLKNDKRGWQAIVGTFVDDPLYEEAMRFGREWREAQIDEIGEVDSK